MLDALRRWAVLLDSAFRIPGTRIRFGLDALIGLVPGLGDLASPAFTAVILLHAAHLRLPRIIQARMVLNAAIDVLLGFTPLAGDLADVAWKANLRNLALLERHARPGSQPAPSDYLFVLGCLAVLAAVALAPIVLFLWLLSRVPLV